MYVKLKVNTKLPIDWGLAQLVRGLPARRRSTVDLVILHNLVRKKFII
jgi:hypothetical protein